MPYSAIRPLKELRSQLTPHRPIGADALGAGLRAGRMWRSSPPYPFIRQRAHARLYVCARVNALLKKPCGPSRKLAVGIFVGATRGSTPLQRPTYSERGPAKSKNARSASHPRKGAAAISRRNGSLRVGAGARAGLGEARRQKMKKGKTE